jgi:hypothetical protein
MHKQSIIEITDNKSGSKSIVSMFKVKLENIEYDFCLVDSDDVKCFTITNMESYEELANVRFDFGKELYLSCLNMSEQELLKWSRDRGVL